MPIVNVIGFGEMNPRHRCGRWWRLGCGINFCSEVVNLGGQGVWCDYGSWIVIQGNS